MRRWPEILLVLAIVAAAASVSHPPVTLPDGLRSLGPLPLEKPSRALPRWQFVVPEWRVNGLYVGMLETDAKARIGEPSARLKYDIFQYSKDLALESDFLPDDQLRLHTIWGSELSYQGRVLVRKGDSRSRVVRNLGNNLVLTRRPHPPRAEDWLDIYWSCSQGNILEDSAACELLFVESVLYAKSERAYPEIAVTHVNLKDNRVISITTRREPPCGKRCYYVNP